MAVEFDYENMRVGNITHFHTSENMHPQVCAQPQKDVAWY